VRSTNVYNTQVHSHATHTVSYTYTVYLTRSNHKIDVHECKEKIPIKTVAKISSDEQNRRRHQRLVAGNTRPAATQQE